ncbi:MAG TPA: glycosyltransferase family 2 protein [Thiobacillus sp.]
MAEPIVCAVTVNWNRAGDTLACIDSLVHQEGLAPHIIVVDNASSDDSVDRIRQAYPQVELIRSETNRMFGGGNNLGIRRALEAGADTVFLINNDATLAPDGLAKLLACAAPDVGILSPLIYYASRPEVIWSSGGRTNPWTLEKTDGAHDRPDPGGWPTAVEQDFVTGCGMLISRQALEQVGLFDEGFLHYYEDSDLCWRMRRAGLRILLVPAAHMWHKVAVSSGGSDSPDERYWMARSSIRFFRKHARGLQKPLVACWRAGSALRTSLRLARNGKTAALRAYWRGLKDGLAER